MTTTHQDASGRIDIYAMSDAADRAALQARVRSLGSKPLTDAERAFAERKRARDRELESIRVRYGVDAAMRAAFADLDAAFAGKAAR